MIKWSDKYSVKFEKIDDQHKTFFSLINKLESLTHMDNYLEQLPRLLNEIVEYANLHFKTEEAILEQAHFPNLALHHEKHEHIKSDIYLECKRVVEKEPTTQDVICLYNYMRDWINTHILDEDMQYVEALKKFYD